jgi:putative ABC transport system permease protein
MKYAIRTLLKTPSFTVVAIATIAIGIAANSAIFSVVNAVLLRPLPFPDEQRVVRVFRTTR